MAQERAQLEAEAAKKLAQVELEAGRREVRWRDRAAAAEAGAREVRADMERRLAALAKRVEHAAKRDERHRRAKGADPALRAHMTQG